MWRGFRNPLQFDDIPLSVEPSAALADAFEEAYKRYARVWSSSLAFWFALLYFQRGNLFWSAVPGLLSVIFGLLQAIALYYLIGDMASADSNALLIVWWMFAVFLSSLGRSLTVQSLFYSASRCGVRWRASIMALVYRKSVRMPSVAPGGCNNLMMVDPDNFLQFSFFMHQLWTSPLQIVVCLVVLFLWMGWAAASAVLVFMLLMPLVFLSMRAIGLSRDRMMVMKDRRINKLTEIMQGIQVIKMFSWEDRMAERVRELRALEIRWIRVFAYSIAAMMILFISLPTLQSAALFSFYAILSGTLEAQIVFPALQVIGMLVWAVLELPWGLSGLMECRTSAKRLDRFMRQDELDLALTLPPNRDALADDRGRAVVLQDFSGEFFPPPAADEGGAATEAAAAATLAGSHAALPVVDGPGDLESTALEMDDAPANQFAFRRISFEVSRGRLVAVVGRVGSGKSALVQACLGELRRTAGTSTVHGQVAYVSQQAWIRNGSVRDNIIFGLPYRRGAYRRALRCCGLEADLAILAAGDRTEIGEKGINLSGGQKQRVSMARAVYADADVYFFDDVMSALDAHVGRHVFEECISGALAAKTRVLVTHQLQYLPNVDEIFVLEDGAVRMRGTYSELLASGVDLTNILTPQTANEDGEGGQSSSESSSHGGAGSLKSSTHSLRISQRNDFDVPMDVEAALRAQRLSEADLATLDEPVGWLVEDGGGLGAVGTPAAAASLRRSLLDSDDTLMDSSVLPGSPTDGVLIDEEERAVGAVGLRVYWSYLAEYGLITCTVLLLLTITIEASDVLSRGWLAVWSGREDASDRVWWYLGVYLGLTLGATVVTTFVRMLLWYAVALGAARRIHDRLLDAVLRSPLSFFHTTPVGRIINRFSKDQESVDAELPDQLSDFTLCVFASLSTIVMSSMLMPVLLLGYPLMLIVFYYLMGIYRAVIRELGRLRSISSSPLIAHFIETVDGLQSLRAFGASGALRSENCSLIDLNSRVVSIYVGANRWLGLRTDLLGFVMFFVAGVVCLLLRNYIPAEISALLLTLVLRMSGDLNWAVRSGSMLEMSMTRVERIYHYSALEPEPPRDLDNDALVAGPKWPERGLIEVQDLSLRYRPDLPLALTGVSVVIEPGMKVGVVGRTGSGKSTLTQALFRLVEPSSGRILIDGVNVHALGLRTLRSRLSIIPQDPILFSGSLRENLDPDALHSDDELWAALQCVQMDTFITAAEQGLGFELEPSGRNLSVGQRQLLCMARALVRRSTVCVMDEATASVDRHTDDLIQHMIRTEFRAATMLIIAHRLETVVDCDRVLVMDKGAAVEYDSPAALLARPESLFSQLVNSTGEENALKLREMIRVSHAST